MVLLLLVLVLQTAVGAGGGGGSLVVSSATGKDSTVRGGTVETGELHSVLEPLRRASRWRFLYSSRETWRKSTSYIEPAEGSVWSDSVQRDPMQLSRAVNVDNLDKSWCSHLSHTCYISNTLLTHIHTHIQIKVYNLLCFYFVPATVSFILFSAKVMDTLPLHVSWVSVSSVKIRALKTEEKYKNSLLLASQMWLFVALSVFFFQAMRAKYFWLLVRHTEQLDYVKYSVGICGIIFPMFRHFMW